MFLVSVLRYIEHNQTCALIVLVLNSVVFMAKVETLGSSTAKGIITPEKVEIPTSNKAAVPPILVLVEHNMFSRKKFAEHLRGACDAYSTYPTAFIGNSCFVFVEVFMTYQQAVNTCAALTLDTQLNPIQGRLAVIAQKRTVMKLIWEKIPTMPWQSSWISLVQVPGTGEPKGIWEICVDPAQTQCYQMHADALPWTSITANPGVAVAPSNWNNERHHGCCTFGNNNDPVMMTPGLSDWNANLGLYGLCEFRLPHVKLQYRRAADGYKAPLGPAQMNISLPSMNLGLCAAECFKLVDSGCVSFAIHNQTDECLLQYMMFAEDSLHDYIHPEAAPGYNWYEPIYY